ncbi:MAG: M48 family metalloprotease [Candidatus Omnitrophica bacterium]|nr:M48 family metalloprotease [Candidatus Omnitrophota bacterium]
MIGKRQIAIFVSILYLSGCVSRPQIHSTSSGQEYGSLTQDEIALGRQINELIISKMAVYEHPVISEYVNKIGKNLAQFAKRQDLPYQFIILRDDRIYATSAPGGFVYITTGFISSLDNEAELAAILAHEIGELQFKDPRLSRLKRMMEKVVTGGAVVAPLFGTVGALALIGLVGTYALVDRGNNFEKRVIQADRVALQLLTEADEDPQGLVDLLYKCLRASPKQLAYLYDYYQSRPVTQARFEKLEQSFRSLDLEGRSFSVNRDRFIVATKPLRSP